MASTRYLSDVRYWPLADFVSAPTNVRFWHKADMRELHCTCPLSGVKRTFTGLPSPLYLPVLPWRES